MKRRLTRGRPPKNPPERRRARHVKVYVTEQEKKRLATRAGEAGLSMSDFCRSALKGAASPAAVPPLHRDALRQLAGISNNLNQLTRHVHVHGDVHEILDDLVTLTDAFRDLLHAWKNSPHSTRRPARHLPAQEGGGQGARR